MLGNFFRKPSGVGSSLNIHMFFPGRLWHAFKVLANEPRYFVDRVNVLLYQTIHPRAPWLTSDAISMLERFLKKDMRGFEWGSGRSTIWLAKRGGALVSVEDNQDWYERVKPRLSGLNVDYRYVAGGGAPYAGQIETFPDRSFDFILVDGSARDACIAAAASKIKHNGMIVVDNADLDIDVTPLKPFEHIRTSNGIWRTDIFINCVPRA